MPETIAKHTDLKMIVAIVQRGKGDVLLHAAIKAGAPAATHFYGRGQGVREKLGPLGMAIQPEKEVILATVDDPIVQPVLSAIVKAGKLDRAGNGFVFVVPVDYSVGFVEQQEPAKT